MYKSEVYFLALVFQLENYYKIVYYGLMTPEVHNSDTRRYVKGSGGRVRNERVGIPIDEISQDPLKRIKEICEGLVVTVWDSSTNIPEPDQPPEIGVYQALVNLEHWGVLREEVPEVLRKLKNTKGKPRCIRILEEPTEKVVGVYLYRAGRTGCAGCFFASNPTDPECTLECSPIDQVEEIRASFHPEPVIRSRKDKKPGWN